MALLLDYLLLLLSVCIIIILSLSIFTSKRRPKFKLPPGPTKLPLIGNLHQLGHLPHRSLFQLSRKHGPLMFLKLGRIPTFVVSSAEVAKEFLKSNDHKCCSRPLVASTSKLTYNFLDVGFSPYGPNWREMRRIILLEFTSAKKVSLRRSMREEETDRMISSISTQSQSVIDLSAMLHALSIDITCLAAFGRRREAGRLRKILQEVEAMIVGFFFADYLPALSWLDGFTGMKGRLEKSHADLDCFFDEVIDEHLDPMRRRSEEEEEEDTVDALLRIQKEDGSNVSREHIKALLLDIMVGGSETSSAVVEWAMTELIRHPQVMTKAQEEVRFTIGKKGKVEESDLPQLLYLNCVVKEVMRLHPPTPLIGFRETMQHFVAGDYYIPAKARVIVSAYAIGREEGSWEMPLEFYPERFVDSSVDVKGRDFQLIPFGAGRRICAGMQLGLVLVELQLANLLYSFDWSLPAGMTKYDIDMEEAAGLTAHRKNALRLVAAKYI